MKILYVGSLNAGGQGIYALDVTSPAGFSDSDVLWEFSDRDNGAGPLSFSQNLGFTFGQPNIARLKGGRWVAIFGNGYNNVVDNNDAASSVADGDGKAYIYIVDLATGSLLGNPIQLGSSFGTTTVPNGIADVAPTDSDGDGSVDTLYAGDLYGNLWKVGIPDAGVAWGTPEVLFVACAAIESPCTSANRQRITSRPQVGKHPTGYGQMVYFGTGSYFETADSDPTTQINAQTFYGIWDKYGIPPAVGGIPSVSVPSTLTRSSLQEQTITGELTRSGSQVRDTSNNKITLSDWKTPFPNPPSGPNSTGKLGWFMDLKVGSLAHKGERMVSSPVLRANKVIFVTLIPDADPCASGGTSWIMELNPFDGSALDTPPFDLNGDGDFTSADFGSGKKSTVGITSTPGIARMPGTDKEILVNSGSDGNLESSTSKKFESDGRSGWVHLR